MLHHAEPFRLGGRALQLLALRDVGVGAFESAFLAIPQREPNRHVGGDLRRAEDPRELHDEGRPRSIVVRRLAPADAVHVRADDVHLAAPRRAPLRAIHHVDRAGNDRAPVQLAKFHVGLPLGIVVHAGARAEAFAARAAPERILGRPPPFATSGTLAAATSLSGSTSAGAAGALPFDLLVREPARIRRVIRDAPRFAAVALELGFDPSDPLAIAFRAFTAFAELRQSLDRRLVFLEVQLADERPDRILRSGGRGHRRRRLRRALRLARRSAEREGGLQKRRAHHEQTGSRPHHVFSFGTRSIVSLSQE